LIGFARAASHSLDAMSLALNNNTGRGCGD